MPDARAHRCDDPLGLVALEPPCGVRAGRGLHPARILVGQPVRRAPAPTPNEKGARRRPLQSSGWDRARRFPPVRSCCLAPGWWSRCTRTPPRRRTARRAPSCAGPRSAASASARADECDREQPALAALLLLRASRSESAASLRDVAASCRSRCTFLSSETAFAGPLPFDMRAYALRADSNALRMLSRSSSSSTSRWTYGFERTALPAAYAPAPAFAAFFFAAIALLGSACCGHSTRSRPTLRNAFGALPLERASSTSSTWSTSTNFMLARAACSGMSSMSASLRRGHDHALDPGALRGQRLLLEAADRQHLAGQRDLAGHRRRRRATGRPRDQRGERRRHRDAGRSARPWAPRRRARGCGCRARRTSRRQVGAELAGVRRARTRAPPAADSCITSPSWPVIVQLARRPGIAVASTNSTSPPTGVQARPVATPGLARCAARRSAEKRRRPSSSRDRSARDRALRASLALGDLARDLAADRADLALEVAHARLARVLLDDRVAAPSSVNSICERLEPVRARSGAARGSAWRSASFSSSRVAGELDHLHAVAQRPAGSCRACSRWR